MTLMMSSALGQDILPGSDLYPQVQGPTKVVGDGSAGSPNLTSAAAPEATRADIKGKKTAGLEEEREFSTFWIIGILINLLVFALFVLWGVREWRKTKRREPL